MITRAAACLVSLLTLVLACFLVGAFKEDDEDVFTIGRNAFFAMPSEDFADEMLKTKSKSFKGATALISGSGNVAQFVQTLDQCLPAGLLFRRQVHLKTHRQFLGRYNR